MSTCKDACSDELPVERPTLLVSKAVRPSLLAWVSVIVALAAGLAGVAWLSTALYAAAILCGAFYFAREAVEELVSEREVGIELLMTAAIAGAISVALVAALYSISEARITDSWTALAEGSELGVQSRHRKHLRESRTAGSPRSPTRRGDAA